MKRDKRNNLTRKYVELVSNSLVHANKILLKILKKLNILLKVQVLEFKITS